MHAPAPAQLGFDALLAEAETVNREQEIARATAHLPGTMAEALPCFRGLLDRHHAAMLAADVEAALSLRAEARELALKLNGGRPGILAGADAPGCVLARETAAAPGAAPLWGQQGDFEIDHGGMRVRITMDGIFGIGASTGFWLGFEAFAVDWSPPVSLGDRLPQLSRLRAGAGPGRDAGALRRPDHRALRGAHAQGTAHDDPAAPGPVRRDARPLPFRRRLLISARLAAAAGPSMTGPLPSRRAAALPCGS